MPSATADSVRASRERMLTWGVAILVVAAPAAIGGVHPATQVALSTAALALLIAYVSFRGRRGLRPGPFAGAAALASAFTLLQLVPLPKALVGSLSPQAYELRMDVTPVAFWIPLSVDVPGTLLACARGIGCFALLLLVGGVVSSSRRALRLLTVVAALGGGLAVVAAVQRLAGMTSILGFYRPRSNPGFGVFGTFVDVNHAASLLSLGALVSAGLAVETSGRSRSLFAILGGLSAGALLLTTSRGALLGFGIGAFVLIAVLIGRSHGIARALIAAFLLLLVGLSATLWINEGLRRRVSEQPQQLVDNQKTRGWMDGLRMAAAYRWTGVGRGAFEAAIDGYRHDDEGVRLVYPENLLVQMTSEWGFPVALVLVAMVLATGARLAPLVARSSPALVGGACGVIAVLVHELVDFSLEFPGVAFPTIVVLATVASVVAADDRRHGPRGYRVPPRVLTPLVAIATLSLGAAGFASRHTLDADFARLHDTIDSGTASERVMSAAIVRHPADDYIELLAADEACKHGRPDAMHHLNRALRLNPVNWQAHRMAALLLLSMNRPAQAALEYRLALDNGMGFDIRELARVLRLHVVEAVPQTPSRLMDLARGLYGYGLPVEADAAAQRAVELSDVREPSLIERARLALSANAANALLPAGRALLAEAESPDAFVVAARVLARAGAQADANAAIEAGLTRNPGNASLFLDGAELRIAAADLDGARALLARAGRAQLTLPERQHAEDMLAEVAERSGDVETATLARARSRLIGRQLRNMTQTRKDN